MRISRKIGISFFVTFLLVILLGAISIYSLRHIYQGLEQVFSKDLPGSRFTYRIAVSMQDVLSELNNFMITGNDNFELGFKRSFKGLQDDMSGLKRFTFKDEEKQLFQQIEALSEDIDGLAKDIFEKKKEIKALFKETNGIEKKFKKGIDGIFDFEESKMLGEKDLLLIQAQYIPASGLIIGARLKFYNLLDGAAKYVISDAAPESENFLENISGIDKLLRDYKNYYGYSLSDKERSLSSELIDLSGQLTPIIENIMGLKKGIKASIVSILGKEKDFMETLDKIIVFKKSGISSKLGVGAALTEDIPAIHNISAIEKDIAESSMMSGRYILTNDKTYKNLYYQLRQNIDKGLKDYERHARLRGTEKFLQDIIESDKGISKAVDSNMDVFEKKEENFKAMIALKSELEKKIDGALEREDTLIKNTQDAGEVLKVLVPARWALIKLKDGLYNTEKLVINYLNEQDAQYKDAYSELYFNMKRYLSEYRRISGSDRDGVFTKDFEQGLEMFNTSVLGLIESYDQIMLERGWSLVQLEDALKKSLDGAVELELAQIEKNKKDIRNRIAVINTLIFLIIGVVFSIAVFIVFYTTKSITIPIQKLYNGAEIIGRGNLDHRLDIKTGDEIQDLAEGFNTMAGELKELYTNLENKVKERTAQLAEANNALALKNKELDDFTYIVSHDLKEPLRGVKAFTKLLMEEYSSNINEEGKDYLKTISDSSTRMARLIEDLLNLSRIGRIKNIEPNVDLNEVLSDMRKNLAYSLEEKKVNLRVTDNFPKVTCDRIRMSEVFSNLVSNAVKYSRKDAAPIVEIGYLDKGDVYEFYVKDNGIGIEEQYYDKVFQIFQRLHAKGEYEGTGAGLTIVKKIIENHGGKIWVSSKVGAGSTFYFTLPKLAQVLPKSTS